MPLWNNEGRAGVDRRAYRRSYNMMVRLRQDERERIERCLERYNRQRALDRLMPLLSQSDFIRYAIDRLCEKVEAGE